MTTRFKQKAINDYKMDSNMVLLCNNKKGQLLLTNPRDACEKFAQFT